MSPQEPLRKKLKIEPIEPWDIEMEMGGPLSFQQESEDLERVIRPQDQLQCAGLMDFSDSAKDDFVAFIERALKNLADRNIPEENHHFQNWLLLKNRFDRVQTAPRCFVLYNFRYEAAAWMKGIKSYSFDLGVREQMYSCFGNAMGMTIPWSTKAFGVPFLHFVVTVDVRLLSQFPLLPQLATCYVMSIQEQNLWQNYIATDKKQVWEEPRLWDRYAPHDIDHEAASEKEAEPEDGTQEEQEVTSSC